MNKNNEANKAIARRWFDEVINQRNLNAIADIYAADYVHHGPEGPRYEVWRPCVHSPLPSSPRRKTGTPS